MNESKGTCCHKCGRVHVKGTKCPRPYLTGAKSCAKRANEGLEDPKDNPCWKGYHPVGTKTKDGKEVPNCVPIDEAKITDHYTDRKRQRGTITGVQVQREAYGTYDITETKQRLIPKLQEELDRRLARLEKATVGLSHTYDVGYVVMIPVLANKGKKYQIKMISGDGEGKIYLVIVRRDALVTMYVGEYTTAAEIESQIRDHAKRHTEYEARQPEAFIPKDAMYVVDIDELYGNKEKVVQKKATEEDLPYKVRTDYRIGSTFTHNQYGTGKVVSAAGGGKGGANGIVDWIEVDFGKPYVSGGKLLRTRKIENIYTSAYFGKTLKKESVLEEDELNEGEFCNECLVEIIKECWDKPIEEAEYRGRKVPLGKPFLTPGGPKKRAVYVKNKKGNVVKVNFGDPNMRIKKSNPKKRKSFRARHRCDTAKDRTTPRYWSCKHW